MGGGGLSEHVQECLEPLSMCSSAEYDKERPVPQDYPTSYSQTRYLNRYLNWSWMTIASTLSKPQTRTAAVK